MVKRLLTIFFATGSLLPAWFASAAESAACKGHIYLSFDTGSQSQASRIAVTLRRHRIHATFFLANEKTVNGDYSLDAQWAPFWKQLVADGHAFGTHTFDHVYALRDLPQGQVLVRPQFGANAGKTLNWTQQQYCDELRRVDQRFQALTGRPLDPFWRSPGGRTTGNLLQAGRQCGYQHVGWAPAGFSGDELPASKASNPELLKRMLSQLRDGDIVMAHMGIWSRVPAWAPENLEPLIAGLEKKGFCFSTLKEHPSYQSSR